MEEYTTVFAWGGDHFGQLGLGGKTSGKTYASPRVCSFNILIKDISCGEEHSAFISNTGHVYTMGSNADGRLGIGTASLKSSPSPCLVEGLMSQSCVKVSCGWGHTMVLTESFDLFSWGFGDYGALGNGGIEHKWAPSPVIVPRGKPVDMDCGSRHTGIILQERNGRKVMAVCGGGEAGQLGTGRREKELTPVVIEFGEDIEQVACGVFHSAFVTAKGGVYTMGGNSFGQLGLGTKKSQSRPEKVMHLENTFIKKVRCSNFTAAVSDKGNLYVWGSGVFGEFLLPHRWSIRDPVADIYIGSGFGVAIDSNNSAYVWGGNSNGELGLDDYDSRHVPTLLPALKGKDIKKIACGGNFCLGLGTDVLSRCKTPERPRRTMAESRKSEESTENWGREPPKEAKSDEMEKLCFEVKQTYKSYEEIKRNFENLSERYEVEKRNYEKHIEELAREISRYRIEIDRCKNQVELDGREIREMSECIEELKRINMEITSEADSYKNELIRYQIAMEDNEHCSRIEFQKIEEKKYQELHLLEERYTQEIMKRKQCEKELEKMSTLVYSYEDTVKNYQHEINQIGKELQQSIQKTELERKRMQNDIERYQKDVSELSKKGELGGIEKEKMQNIFKAELDKYFKENKELMFQLEMSKDKISELSIENSEIVSSFENATADNERIQGQFKLDSERMQLQFKADNERIQAQFRSENERMQTLFKAENEKIVRENMDLKRKMQSAMQELQNYESAKSDLNRVRNENTEYLNKIESLYIENEKISKESHEFKQRLEDTLVELKRIDSMSYDLERVNKENLQLLKRIDYLATDNEKISTSLSAEIEELSNQKQDLIQKYDQIYLEKEKKSHTYSSEIEKFSKENYELRKKNDILSIEKEKSHSDLSRLTNEFNSIKHQCELALSENRNLSVKLKDLSQESADLKLKLSQTISDTDRTMQKQRQEIELLQQEKTSLSSMMTSDHASTSSEIQRLHLQLSSCERDISMLTSMNSQQDSELKKLQDQSKSIISENSFLKQSTDEMKYEIEKLRQRSAEQEYAYSSSRDLNVEWETRYAELHGENSRLRQEITDLEGKNRQLLENLERELAQRAKEYKERTMSILTTPLRSSSPHLRPPTPGDASRGRYTSYNRTQTPLDAFESNRASDEFQGNTAARLLQTLEDSPRGKNGNRSNSRTPTKEDIKARIATLMNNRNRIETEINRLDDV